MFNNFGATEAQVLLKFATGGYTPVADEFGGASAVADAIADCAHAVISSMPLQMLNALQRPEFCIVEPRATAGQTLFPFPTALRPVLTGKVHVWAGVPQIFTSRPILRTDPWLLNFGQAYASIRSPVPSGPAVEMDESEFTPSTTGATLATARSRGDMVLASWDVDVEGATFSVPSIADAVAGGAAAVLGSKVYATASAQWEYVARLGEAWASFLTGLSKGELVPAELRAIQWWKAPEKAQDNGVGSVRAYRG